eukprot:CAMPEP_0168562564 /NCGR_PEP_ID=MMETSP0413-20121227/12196_1 /TAXON_ID=136452 /ORGANISM="Filamoeba nolandi, Strain NC-AS-23-1" /LENGTH=731 /DNA_ID=CAMNT_0008594011 /DNA_START=371 /DNA_END=2566 /DNA_ORIENTATION=-
MELKQKLETEKDSRKKEKKKSKEDKDKSDVKKDSEKKSKKDTSYSDTEAVEIKNKDKDKKKEKEKSKDDKKEKDDKQKVKEDKQKEKDKKEKEEKEKKEKEKQKAKDEKEKKEKEEKKKEKEKEKHKSEKHKSVDASNSSISETIKYEPSPILANYDKSGESEEELSKPEEGVMQWITKLKKAHSSRLITITNQSKFMLERKKLHQTKGKWRRKPPDSIYLNNSAQFGVEGKSGTEGGCSFSISEDYADNLEFIWTYNNEKDKIPTTYCVVPTSLSEHVVVSVLPKLSDKFCDIQFVIKNKSDEKSIDTHSVSGSAHDTSVSENESETVSVASAKSMIQSLQRSGSDGSLSAPAYKVTEYHQGQSQNDDSSSESEDEASKEENRRKSLIRNMKLKQSDESVEHADSKTLAAAVSSLKLAAPISGNLSDGGSARSARRRTRPPTVAMSSPDSSGSLFAPPNLNLFAKENESSITIPNPNLTESEREDDDSSVKTTSPQAHNEEEEDVEVDINEKSKNLMKSAFSKLESGHFSDALADVNETLRLFVSLSDPRAKQKESKICSIYKFGLNILINRPRETDPQRVALLLKTLADLTWQPKHRIVCIRMAIKANMEAKNYGVAGRFIQQLLPLALADKKNQETNLQLCKDNSFTDQIEVIFPYTCPHCTKHTNVGNLRCNSCNAPILMCYNSFEIIQTTLYYQCEYCDAVLAKKSGKCGFCNFGTLKEKSFAETM